MTERYSFRCQRDLFAIEDVIKNIKEQSSYFDVTIVTKDYKTVSAIRLVLAISSKYFQEILVHLPKHQPIILDEVCYDEFWISFILVKGKLWKGLSSILVLVDCLMKPG